MRLDHLLSMENVVEVKRHFTVFDERIPVEKNCCSIFRDREQKRIVGLTNAEGPPVPIPNTEVKLCSADSTMLATAWEGRSWPTPHPCFFSKDARPEWVNNPWGCSSAGRAPALQAGGHGFESHHLHQTKPKGFVKKLM